ncbi:hypothetical protein B0G81_3184 [Paraburkholderia sp. BL6665CI2N2]|nr:hypothetical protein B0G81_3184 [Paraburkholderia sp. BL6665CI2N2]
MELRRNIESILYCTRTMIWTIRMVSKGEVPNEFFTCDYWKVNSQVDDFLKLIGRDPQADPWVVRVADRIFAQTIKMLPEVLPETVGEMYTPRTKPEITSEEVERFNDNLHRGKKVLPSVEEQRCVANNLAKPELSVYPFLANSYARMSERLYASRQTPRASSSNSLD